MNQFVHKRWKEKEAKMSDMSLRTAMDLPSMKDVKARLLASRYRQGDDEVVDREYDFLFEYFQNEMPYGTQKARDGDPYQWIANRLESFR